MGDSPELRVSDADREATVAILREAGGEGRLTFEELAERVERADAARTASELEALTADLAASRPRPPAAPRKEKRWVVAVMGGAERKGRWRPAARMNVVAIMGGAAIDLRDAEIDAPEIEITAVTVMGGIEIIVPEGVEVDLNDFALMGGNSGPKDAPVPPGAPVVRVRAYSLMGGVAVSRKKPRRNAGGEPPPALPHRWGH
jgi:Domain of unknown function (DUF1707)/Cell wall-active antibiotics response 4TMS YvqF